MGVRMYLEGRNAGVRMCLGGGGDNVGVGIMYSYCMLSWQCRKDERVKL